MKIVVNGTEVPVTSADGFLHIDIAVDPAGETLPPTFLTATGGKLDCYRSRLTQTGDIHVHLFGAESGPEERSGVIGKVLEWIKKHL